MRLVTFVDGGTMIGALRDNDVVMLDGVAPDMLSLIEMGSSGLRQAAQIVMEGVSRNLRPLDQVQLLAPITRPQ